MADATEGAMAVAQGMGNASRANMWDGGSAYTAPAMVWLNGRFDIHGGVRIGTDGDRVYQVSAYDGQTSVVGLGVQWLRHVQEHGLQDEELPGWRRVGQALDDRVADNVLAASIAMGGVHHLFSGGLGLRFYSRNSELAGTSQGVNLAPSVGVIAADQLTLTLTAENIIPDSVHPFAIGFGSRWHPTEMFSVAADLLSDIGSDPGQVLLSPMLGAEYRIGVLVPVRLGWMRDGETGHAQVTGGLGLANEYFGFTYAARIDLDSGDSLNHWHGASIRISL